MTDAINTFALHVEKDGILHFEGFHHILRTQENQMPLAGSAKIMNYEPRQSDLFFIEQKSTIEIY